MKAESCIGRVCISRAGRDKGKLMMIYAVTDDDYVLVTDGVLRKLEKPKRKKLKHLKLEPMVLCEIANGIEQGEHILDADIRKALANYAETHTNKEK